jgi:hypothetical protein
MCLLYPAWPNQPKSIFENPNDANTGEAQSTLISRTEDIKPTILNYITLDET